MATRIILIRHGETEWNRKRIYCGSSDIRLNKNGRKQAQKLRKKMRNEDIHKVYSSDRKRAIETARIVFGKHRVSKIKELREMHFGCLEGLTHNEVMSRYQDVYCRWLNDPFGVRLPDGESLQAFRKRVVSGIRKIARRNKGKAIAVISHGGAISVFLNNILRSRDFWKYIPKSIEMAVVEYDAKGGWRWLR